MGKSGDVACVPGNRDYSYTFKDYDQHAHVNCYDGHGGTAGGSDDGFKSGLLASDCVKACDVDASCSCFVYNWSQKQCFLRSECQLDQCEVGEEGGESNLSKRSSKKDAVLKRFFLLEHDDH